MSIPDRFEVDPLGRPNESIAVMYTSVSIGGVDTLFVHKELVYTRYDGSVIVVGGGPNGDILEIRDPIYFDLADPAQALAWEGFNDVTVAFEVVETGPDLAEEFGVILADFDRINEANIDYTLRDTNSNWAVDRALIAAGIPLPTDENSPIPGITGLWAPGSIDVEDIATRGSIDYRGGTPDSFCFAAGTQISMANGESKNIEQIEIGDVVSSYKSNGEVVPRVVTNTFSSFSNCTLNLHGTVVTPGHLTLCGDGVFQGQHVPIIDILLSDGCVVREDGKLIRLSINQARGALEDRFVKMKVRVSKSSDFENSVELVEIRVGTLLLDKDGSPRSVLDCVHAQGMIFDADQPHLSGPI